VKNVSRGKKEKRTKKERKKGLWKTGKPQKARLPTFPQALLLVAFCYYR
jgi:hypothetical protein